MLKLYFKTNLLIRILLGLILGCIFGLIFHGNKTLINFIDPFGVVFIRLLKMLIVPIIGCSLIIGTSSIHPSSLGRVGLKSLAFYFLTSLCAVTIGLICGNLSGVGNGLKLSSTKAITLVDAKSNSFSEILLNIVPTNPFQAIGNAQILPIIFFCVCFGIALSFIKDSQNEEIRKSADIVYKFFDGCANIMYLIVKWIMEYAPIGVFALLFKVFAQNESKVLIDLLGVVFVLYFGFLLQIVLVYALLCALIKINPIEFFKRIYPVMLTAFVTRSSNGTLPLSMKTAEEHLGVSKGIYSFVLPVGATINMNGTALYQGVAALFITNACGISLNIDQYFTIILTSILAAVGTAGIPGAGVMMLLLTLESIGVDVKGNVAIAYGMILGIDAILDMGRTAMNVGGDMVACFWIAKSEKEVDNKKWENKE